MAIDGPGIIDSDLAHDVYNDVMDLYDSGVPIETITERLSEWESQCADDIEVEILLAASAKALWEIGHLDDSRRLKLDEIVAGGQSLQLWTNVADELLAKERGAVLERLLRQIASARKVPRARKKYTKVAKKLFCVGDCVQLDASGTLYRAVVCKIHEYRGDCQYAMLVMSPDTGISSGAFAAGFYYGHHYGHHIGSTVEPKGYELGPHVIRPEHRMLLRSGNPFQIVGHVEIDPTTFSFGSFGGVLNMADVIDDFARTVKNEPARGMKLFPLRDLLRHADAK